MVADSILSFILFQRALDEPVPQLTLESFSISVLVQNQPFSQLTLALYQSSQKKYISKVSRNLYKLELAFQNTY